MVNRYNKRVVLAVSCVFMMSNCYGCGINKVNSASQQVENSYVAAQQIDNVEYKDMAVTVPYDVKVIRNTSIYKTPEDSNDKLNGVSINSGTVLKVLAQLNCNGEYIYILKTNQGYIPENMVEAYVENTDSYKSNIDKADSAKNKNDDDADSVSNNLLDGDMDFEVVSMNAVSMFTTVSTNKMSGPSEDFEQVEPIEFAKEVIVDGKVLKYKGVNTLWYRVKGESAYVSGNDLAEAKPEDAATDETDISSGKKQTDWVKSNESADTNKKNDGQAQPDPQKQDDTQKPTPQPQQPAPDPQPQPQPQQQPQTPAPQQQQNIDAGLAELYAEFGTSDPGSMPVTGGFGGAEPGKYADMNFE